MRILRAVKTRVESRADLVAKVCSFVYILTAQTPERCNRNLQMSEDMPSSANIARARQIKEMEALHEAWTTWLRTRQVSGLDHRCMRSPMDFEKA